MALHETITDGVATVVMDNPPVNALGIADTYALADLLDGYGTVSYTHLTLPTLYSV